MSTSFKLELSACTEVALVGYKLSRMALGTRMVQWIEALSLSSN